MNIAVACDVQANVGEFGEKINRLEIAPIPAVFSGDPRTIPSPLLLAGTP